MAVRIGGSSNYKTTATVAVGITAVRASEANKNRAGYRIIAPVTNVDSIYRGDDNRVATTDPDQILPGGRLIDEGEWNTIYRGEVWLISGTAAQSSIVEEIVRQ